MPVDFADPVSQEPLVVEDDGVYTRAGHSRVAEVVDTIPRFVDGGMNYAEDSFGFQWKKWRNTLSDARNTGSMRRSVILRRTHFDEYDTEGKTILECGMGGGDDTEVLLQFPFAEVHSFDLTTAVERARDTLDDPRLTLSQASIFSIPYPDESFDFVYCHRVLQHTPDPAEALRQICRKVKPGGVLFAHSYKKSWRYLMHYKYKYRWLTKRVPRAWVLSFIDRFGRFLFRVNELAGRTRFTRVLGYNFVPFDPIREYGSLDREGLIEVCKLVTFDALTPTYDKPMTTKRFLKIIEEEGFRVDHLQDPPRSPLCCTATRAR